MQETGNTSGTCEETKIGIKMQRKCGRYPWKHINQKQCTGLVVVIQTRLRYTNQRNTDHFTQKLEVALLRNLLKVVYITQHSLTRLPTCGRFLKRKVASIL